MIKKNEKKQGKKKPREIQKEGRKGRGITRQKNLRIRII